MIAKVDQIASCSIESVNNLIKNTKAEKRQEWDADVDIPSIYRSKIQKLLKKNKDIFTSVDSELGSTDTVTMKIDMGNNPHTTLRPY